MLFYFFSQARKGDGPEVGGKRYLPAANGSEVLDPSQENACKSASDP